MPSIRPLSTPLAPATARPGPPESVRAAQRAFFQAALTATPAAVPPPPAQASTAPVQAAPVAPVSRTTTAQAQAEAPDKILRPGSLIDIRV